MPIVRYTWRHPEGHELQDRLTLGHCEDVRAAVLDADPVFKNEDAKLLKVEILNPLVHEHKWQRTGKMGERVYYACEHCGVVAWRRFSMFSGPVGTYNRDDKYKSVKYETCRSPLKEMPPSTSLFKR